MSSSTRWCIHIIKIDLMFGSYSFGKNRMVGRNSTLIHSNCYLGDEMMSYWRVDMELDFVASRVTRWNLRMVNLDTIIETFDN